MSSAGTQLGKQDSAAPEVRLRALLVEDNALDAALVVRALNKEGFDVIADVVQDEAAFALALQTHRPEVVLADYNLPSWTGMETLGVLRREGLDIPMILVSGALGDVTAVECIRQGATDYVLKDGLARLPEVVRRALREKQERALRRQMEEDLAKKVDELARSNGQLEQFAYVASHDLQEPLRMVANYTQLLAERYRGKLDENADKYIHYAVDGAMRMQAMIQDLLAFSRAGRNEIDLQRVDCNVALDQALNNLYAAIKENGAVVKHNPLPTVMGSNIQITQVFQNLIGNAIKFHGAETPAVQVSAEKQDGEWLFSVADNGIGIAAEHSEVIFAIFQRLHTRQEYSGNGIGLSICKKIIERHGGRIWLDAKEGQGATFRFTLPAVAGVAKGNA
jgi:signal transduction histidine kinase